MFQLAAYTLVFLLAREAARHHRRKPWIALLPLVLVGGFEASAGLLQYADGKGAPSGTYADRDLFAAMLELTLPITCLWAVAALTYTQSEGPRRPRCAVAGVGLLLLSGAMFFGVLQSLSKMGFLAVVGSFCAMGSVLVWPRLSGWKRACAIVAVLTSALVILVVAPPEELISSYGAAAEDPSAEGRLPIAKDTMHLVAAYPLFGSGLGTYSPALLRYQSSQLTVAWTYAHNDYLQLLSELGFLGILIPVSFACAAVLLALRASHNGLSADVQLLAVGCLGGLTAALIHSLTEFNAYTPANATAIFWVAGVAAGLPSRALGGREPAAPPGGPQVRWLAIGLGCVVSLYSMAMLLYAARFAGDPRAERIFCRFAVCDSDGIRDSLVQQHANSLTKVPVGELVHLLRRDPAGPDRWEDVADAYVGAGDLTRARFCFNRALTLAPHVPYISFRAAKFHFALGEAREALADMSVALAGDPFYDNLAFAAYDENGVSVEDVSRYGLPDARSARSYFLSAMKSHEASVAAKVWSVLARKGWADNETTDRYVNFLVQSRSYSAAAQATADYSGQTGPMSSDFILNGSFEFALPGNPLDWRLDRRDGVNVSFDSSVAHSGRRSARVDFDGTENVESVDLSQTAYVPAGRYKFQAWVKLDGVTTDQGPSFAISGERWKAETENMIGSSDWRLIEKEFEVPRNEPGLVQVRLFRRKSWKFDCLVKGTVWIDQVKIAPLR